MKLGSGFSPIERDEVGIGLWPDKKSKKSNFYITMNMRFVKGLLSGLVLTATTSFGQIAVTNNMTADQAVQYLLGPGVTYFNAQFTGNAIQLGQLTGLGAPSNLLPRNLICYLLHSRCRQ